MRGAQRETPAIDSTPHGATRRTVVIALVILVILATAGVVAARWVRSPQQQAADAAPPARTVLTAPVVDQVVAETVVMRGAAGASAPVTLPVPQASSSGQGTAKSASGMVISATPLAVGTQVQAGQVVIEVSGRPVIALPGAVPAYRDLAPGDTGPDVVQLQKALTTIGLNAGAADGQYGEQTKKAVRQLYQRLGYSVPSTSGLGEPPDPTVTQAQAAVTQAQRALQDAQTAAAAGAAASVVGQTPAPADPTAVQRAQQDLSAARQAYTAAVAASGPIVPMAEVAFLPTLPARLVSLGGSVGQTPQKNLAVFDTGQPVVVAQADPGQASALRTGMSATLIDDATGFTATAKLSAIGQPVSDTSTGTQSVPVTITPDQALPDAEASVNFRVTIDQASSGGKVLAVPIAAITARADGSTYVTTVTKGGAQQQVAVSTGVIGQGMVQVTPSGTGALKAGDTVVTSK